jgi:hypothetical protein
MKDMSSYRRLAAFICTLTVMLSGSSATAAGSISYLGKPTNILSTNQYFPLSGFHKVGKPKGSSRPTLYFVGTLSDEVSAAERWPLVKALDQFGMLSGAKAGSSYSTYPQYRVPTFDLSHVRYVSSFLTFSHVDLLRGNQQYYQPMNHAQLSL